MGSYISRIRIPTFLIQGQSDTLFDIQEAVATYRSLRSQGTPVKMLWRSSGHSGGGIDGESDSTKLETAYESRLALQWFNYHLRGIQPKPALDFSFLRDWVGYKGDAAPAVGVVPRYPAGPSDTLFLSGTNQLAAARSRVAAGSAGFAAIPGASGSGGAAIVDAARARRRPARSRPTTARRSPRPPTWSGIPRLQAPPVARRRSRRARAPNPAGKLVLFAKLLDVGPDGGTTLPRNQLSAVRVADVTKPVEIELPGIAHRFAKGHRLRLVVTTANSTNKGNTLAGPVSIATDSANPGTLTLPRVGASVSTPAGPLPLPALADRPAQHRPHPPRLHARADPAPRPRPARAPHRSHLPLLRHRPHRRGDRRLLEPLPPRQGAAGDHHRPRPRQPPRAGGVHGRAIRPRLLPPPPGGPGNLPGEPAQPAPVRCAPRQGELHRGDAQHPRPAALAAPRGRSPALARVGFTGGSGLLDGE